MALDPVVGVLIGAALGFGGSMLADNFKFRREQRARLDLDRRNLYVVLLQNAIAFSSAHSHFLQISDEDLEATQQYQTSLVDEMNNHLRAFIDATTEISIYGPTKVLATMRLLNQALRDCFPAAIEDADGSWHPDFEQYDTPDGRLQLANQGRALNVRLEEFRRVCRQQLDVDD